jgi:hypothetical protein
MVFGIAEMAVAGEKVDLTPFKIVMSGGTGDQRTRGLLAARVGRSTTVCAGGARIQPAHADGFSRRNCNTARVSSNVRGGINRKGESMKHYAWLLLGILLLMTACSSSDEPSSNPPRAEVTGEELNWATSFRNMMAQNEITKGVSADAQPNHRLEIRCEFYKYSAGSWVIDNEFSDNACASLYQRFNQTGNSLRDTARVSGFKTVVFISAVRTRSFAF